MNKQEFIHYLKTDLIPELKEDGMCATAEDFQTALLLLDPPKTPIQTFMERLGEFLAANEVMATADLNIQAIEGRMTIITATLVGNTRILAFDNEDKGTELANFMEE